MRTGADWSKSYENFDTNGFITDFSVSGQKAEIRDFTPYVFGEYGVAEGWSVWSRLQFMDSVLSAQQTGTLLASGSGLGDAWVGFKYALANTYPLFTAETFFKLPMGKSVAATTNDMVTGDGNFDIGVRLHIGHRDGPVLFAISPGILLRFGGYSTAGLLEAAIQYNFQDAYGRLFAEGIMSFSETALPPSTTANHNLLGTGGSYMKLAASPLSFGAGARAGYNFSKGVGVEAYAAMNFQGMRTARYLRFGTDLIFNFDFFKGDLRPRIREVPFKGGEEESQNFD